jgi:hypothetical protein|tara:strand:+ start:3596 stop:5053 length:1458 start_codon:yes stop_codon:yes gene_type:complete
MRDYIKPVTLILLKKHIKKMPQETLELSARRYAPTYYASPTTRIILPPESFAIGSFFKMTQPDKYASLKSWQESRRESKDSFCELKGEYQISLNEKTPKGKNKKIKKDILSLKPSELLFALKQKMRFELGSYNLWNVGGSGVISPTKETDHPYTGTVVMTANIKSMDNAVKGEVSKYWFTSITGPFIKGKELSLTDLYCGCQDFRWNSTKEGYTNINTVCTHIAALMDFAKESPKDIRNYLNTGKAKDSEVFLPFNFNDSNLHIDILIDHLFNTTNFSEISQRILKNPEIYTPKLTDLIKEEKVFYDVLVQRNAKRNTDPKNTDPFDSLSHSLKSILGKKGYRLKGHCIEFKDTEYQTVSLSYERGPYIRRILFNEKFPPITTLRRKLPNQEVRIFDSDTTPNHPFSYLFEPQKVLDDRTRKKTLFEVRIPFGLKVPKILWRDYAKTIHKYSSGGIEGVISKVRNRKKIPNQKVLIAWLEALKAG